MTESAINSLLNIVRLSLILMAFICVVALLRDQKLIKPLLETVVKFLKRFF